MNINTKLLNKILANTLENHVKNVIHHDREGLKTEMKNWFNIRTSNIIHFINTFKEKES